MYLFSHSSICTANIHPESGGGGGALNERNTGDRKSLRAG